MDIYKKRCFADQIDTFLIMVPTAFLVVFITMNYPNAYRFPYNIIIMLLVFVYWIICDIFDQFIFKNASIGMKLMKISKYNKDWEYQTLRQCLKTLRVCSKKDLQIFSRLNSFRIWPPKEDIMEWFYYEIEHVGTFFIENSVYDELSEKARAMEGDFVRNMTDLYIAYLERIYLDC